MTEPCETDEGGCVTEGEPLWWRNGQLTTWVDAAGSERRGVSAEATLELLRAAVAEWKSARCTGDQRPEVNAEVGGLIEGAQVTTTPPDGGTVSKEELEADENVILYADDGWVHEPAAVAVTTTTFDLNTGEILDSDTELNSVHHPLTVVPSGADVDIGAVLTHEFGHTLGLDHTDVPDATMQPESEGFGFEALRTIEPDDEAGICAVYPLGFTTPGADEPSGCSCIIPPSGGSRPGHAWWLGLVGGLFLRRRQSRRA